MNVSPAARVLAVIPARGGSKGIAHKNLRLVGGKSLVRRAVECGRSSRSVTLTVVSTDDADIAREAADAGAQTIPRPADLATDETPTDLVVIHAVRELAREGADYDAVVVLQPTCPLRAAEDVDAAVELLMARNTETVVSICEVGDLHPARMYVCRDGLLEPCAQEPEGRRRQALPPVYHRNGAVYCTWVDGLLGRGDLMGSRIRGLVMPRCRSVNVDDEMDLTIANALIAGADEELR